MNIKKFGDYFCSLESVYVLGLIVVTIVNLILFSNSPQVLLSVNVLAVIAYFLLSRLKDKWILLAAVLNFAFWGVILESFVIKKTNFALKYRKDSRLSYLYVPAWLFTIYIVFVIASLYTYECFKLLLS